MYKDYSAITNPVLLPWVEKLSHMGPSEIDGYRQKFEQPLEVPPEARSFLEHHDWATAARAICMRAPTDNPDLWRNATPPDRVPIVQDFKNAEKTPYGYKFTSSPAADYNHQNEYRYIGRDDQGNYQFVNTVTRSHKTDKDDVTVGRELLVLSPTGEAVTMYLGNDGRTPGLPAAFREVRVLGDLRTAYTAVLSDINKADNALPSDDTKGKAALQVHRQNYQGHLDRLGTPQQ